MSAMSTLEIEEKIKDWKELAELYFLIGRPNPYSNAAENKDFKERILAIYDFRQAILDPENQPSQYGTNLLKRTNKENCPECGNTEFHRGKWREDNQEHICKMCGQSWFPDVVYNVKPFQQGDLVSIKDNSHLGYYRVDSCEWYTRGKIPYWYVKATEVGKAVGLPDCITIKSAWAGSSNYCELVKEKESA